jgi:hypothetical protein
MQGQSPEYTIPEDMPKELTAELSRLIESPVNSKLYLTFGPKYSPDTPGDAIRNDFEQVIQLLIQMRQLDARSSVVKEMVSDLAFTSSFSSSSSLSNQPHSQREIEVNNALLMAFTAVQING